MVWRSLQSCFLPEKGCDSQAKLNCWMDEKQTCLWHVDRRSSGWNRQLCHLQHCWAQVHIFRLCLNFHRPHLLTFSPLVFHDNVRHAKCSWRWLWSLVSEVSSYDFFNLFFPFSYLIQKVPLYLFFLFAAVTGEFDLLWIYKVLSYFSQTSEWNFWCVDIARWNCRGNSS